MNSSHFQSGVTVKIVCGWCGRLLREAEHDGATSHGICEKCSSVLEGSGRSSSSEMDDFVTFLDDHVNQLMCRVYQTRQLLLDVEHRVPADTELMSRVRQALASLRHQERVVAEMQQRISTE